MRGRVSDTADPLRQMDKRVPRLGAIVVLTAVLIVVLLAMVAFCVDLGYLMVARTELQRSCDAAALAATWELIEDNTPSQRIDNASRMAVEYASHNPVCGASPKLNLRNGDVVVGKITDFSDRHTTMTFDDPSTYNAVFVRIRRNASINGKVPLFVAKIFGLASASLHAEATAAIVRDVDGFRFPPGDHLPVLPITLLKDAWDNLPWGDNWKWDPDAETVVPGSDGIDEVVMYPETTDSSGNFGTLNIGTSANSTAHLSDQILHGLSAADLDYHGGELKLDESGELHLGGDTGISAGIKDDLAAIRGQKRALPIYCEVDGSGSNAKYTIVKFVGIRIMEVQLTGKNKRLVVQPSGVVINGAIPADNPGASQFVFSPSRLVK